MDKDIKELLQDISTEQLIVWLRYWQEQLNARYSQKIRHSKMRLAWQTCVV